MVDACLLPCTTATDTATASHRPHLLHLPNHNLRWPSPPSNMLKPLQIVVIVILAMAAPPIKGMNTNLHDTTATAAATMDDVPGGSPEVDQMKCGGCPCNNPCFSINPPPPPPPPPPSPPPPLPKMPSTPGLNCPPPPTTGGGYGLAPPNYIYITGPPGNDLYPTNPYFSAVHGRRNLWVAPALMVMFGLLGVLIVY